MNISNYSISVNEFVVQVIRKKIKNVHLAVHPPDGRIRISVPLHISDDNIRQAVISKIKWIKKQQAHIHAQPRQPKLKMVSGENHYLWGKQYRLEVIERPGRHEAVIKNNTWLSLYVNPGTTTTNRERVINEWYRAQIKAKVPGLLTKWEPIIGEKVSDWNVKKMKTRWGSCNIKARRIWLNLTLAKKPAECLEYVFVHEMVHLLERLHNDNFRAHMDNFMPDWRLHKDMLNRYPLINEGWEY